jgi:pimeloyl-ACP methyl ester carboxylesterase
MGNTTINFIEKPLEAEGPLGPLAGTMLSPEKLSGPIVLIIPGSGPTDRNGNGPLGLNASTYKLLADGLAARGIASVRIDKRGMFGSANAVTDPNDVTIADYAKDIHSWVRTIRARTGAPCVWVLGHSEGGLAALFASLDDREMCGLVLVATAGRPLGEVLRRQIRPQLTGTPLLGQALSAIAMLEAGRHVDVSELDPALLPLFNPAVQRFLISEFAIDPSKLIAEYRKPILIVQGERDIQVTAEDARRLHAAAPASRLTLLPNTNHVLKEVKSSDRTANIATYGHPGLPLAPGVVGAIAGFISDANARE